MPHAHESAVGSRRMHRTRLVFVLLLVVGFLGVEVAAAVISDSLALWSDAGHMLTDALGLGMALSAMVLAERLAAGRHRTFGRYRLEIVAAAGNAGLLVAVGSYTVVEGIRRLGNPPDVASGLMLVVAAFGLVVNLTGWLILRGSAGESLNIEGAMMEVAADLLASASAVVAALLLRYGGWRHADAVFGIAIGAFIVPRAIRLGMRALRVLMQHAPAHLDLDSLERSLLGVGGVTEVHDLHVWTLTSNMDVATVHLMVADSTGLHDVLDNARAVLRDGYGIAHATIQVEPADHGNCIETGW